MTADQDTAREAAEAQAFSEQCRCQMATHRHPDEVWLFAV